MSRRRLFLLIQGQDIPLTGRQLPDVDVSILGDPTQINQIMINLCTNAAQAVQETGNGGHFFGIEIHHGIPYFGILSSLLEYQN